MDTIMQLLNTHIVDPYVLWVPKPELPPEADNTWINPSYSVLRQFFVMWAFLYAMALVVYFSVCSITYWYYFTPRDNNIAMWRYDGVQIRAEMWTSVWSGCIMAGMTAPLEVAVLYGYGRVYSNVSDYGWWYVPFSCILFLVFTDSLIYWIHRGLHLPSLYWIHKLHHRYKNTTPYSAFSFHPLDGWSQGLPYHIFAFIVPMHKIMYMLVLFLVGLWTMNIHDRFTVNIPGVNGAAHHTVHHTKFFYNYGQYFTFWDRLCGTWKDPWSVSPYKQLAAGVPASNLLMNDSTMPDELPFGPDGQPIRHTVSQSHANGKSN